MVLSVLFGLVLHGSEISCATRFGEETYSGSPIGEFDLVNLVWCDSVLSEDLVRFSFVWRFGAIQFCLEMLVWRNKIGRRDSGRQAVRLVLATDHN